VVAFVDVEEIGIGWPMWGFTNWECGGMRFGLGWTREHVLAGYGQIDMTAYRLALLIRLSRPFTFCGSTGEQILRTVEARDLEQLNLMRSTHNWSARTNERISALETPSRKLPRALCVSIAAQVEQSLWSATSCPSFREAYFAAK
jgi:hypothetical protein